MNPTSIRCALSLLTFALPLSAQGLHPTDGGLATNLAGLRLTDMRVRATIQDQAATTELEQTFTNTSGTQREAIWILPLPPGATADRFAMIVDGKRMESEVLDASSARQVYEQIVRQRRDPGLLEYAGRGCLRARVFPIPANGSVRVEARYRQVLPATAGTYEWSFPLRGAAAAGQAPEKLALDLRLACARPVRTVYAPLAGVEVVRDGDCAARVSSQTRTGVPARDLQVFFGLEEREFGVDVLTYRKGDEPGYFLLALAPKQEWTESAQVRRVVQLVVDTSGSMSGNKIEQARGALRYFVKSLRPSDWFNLIAFSTEARPLFPAVVPADADAVRRALEWIETLRAAGGTNIEDALRTALGAKIPADAPPDAQLVPVTAFITDGCPTVGIVDPNALIALVGAANPLQQRMFMFGVGNDLDTVLLDRIAERTCGSRDYVREDEDIEVKTGALFDRLAHPVMTELAIACDGASFERVHPNALPDLFRGDQIVVLGRYLKPGRHTVRVRGMFGGERRELAYECDFTAGDRSRDFVPALWAERRVAVLLDAMRLNGRNAELVDEVTKLGREFSIVTPFTSHLVLEDRVAAGGAGSAPRPGPSGPTTPGAGGPSTPAAGGPATGGPGAGGPATGAGLPPGDVTTSSDDFYMGAGRLVAPTVDHLLLDLQRAGALPRDADESTLRAMIARIGAELQDADRRLRGLGTETGGSDAVDGSLYLRRMLANGRGDIAPLAALLTRRVGEVSLRLRAGTWTDVAFDGPDAAVRDVVAFSDDYFALLAAHPELGPVLAFSTRVLVVIDGAAVRIVEPPEPPPAKKDG